MLSRAKSANVRFSQVVQLFAPPTNPGAVQTASDKLSKNFPTGAFQLIPMKRKFFCLVA